jgi:energy-coupling factor transporter ATP-binding protein EcfA2
MSTPIIEVQNFSYRYPRTEDPVIKNISLTVGAGEFIGIVGPTGAGKTTLCLAMAGLLPQVGGGHVEGQILLAGNNTVSVPMEKLLFRVEEKKALVGITLQDPEGQLVGMTVEEDLAFGPENLGLPSLEIEQRIREVLELTRMEKYRFVFPYKLSGGQKQRVAIGSTLALRPQVLILDEPTSELDPVGRKEVFSLIKELKEKSDLAIVVVEHHTEELAIYCDRVWLMNKGEIILQDSVVNFFEKTDLLRSSGVRPPDGVEFIAELRSAGVLHPPRGLLTEGDIVDYISTLFRGKNQHV